MATHVKQRQRQKPAAVSLSRESSAWQQALGDCIGVCIWAAGSSIFGEVAERLHDSTGYGEGPLNIALVTLGFALLGPVLSQLHGAMINPVDHIALLCAGKGSWATPLRVAGQLLGAVLGTYVATNSIPEKHQGKFHLLSGKVQIGVSRASGFACEAGLVLLMTLLLLYLIEVKNKNPLVEWAAPHLRTIFVCAVGAHFTGPSLNPFLSFAWNRLYHLQSWKEHVIVFWLGPFTGAIAGASLWRAFVPLPVDPTKRSNRSKAAGKAAVLALQRAKARKQE